MNGKKNDFDFYPVLLQLQCKDQRNDRGISVCQGMYFDGNWKNVLINEPQNFNWSCAPNGGFWKITKAYCLLPIRAARANRKKDVFKSMK